ncbi:hypothetical protein AAEX28_10850 [Lentisphaerota bacterium WC36G]|nr:hypothetical protein LJT99_13690 [Lentisphaerae bacterium WC36]
MKKLIYTILFALLCSISIASKAKTLHITLHSSDKILIQSLIMTETGGDDKAIGDDGLAYGALQIHQGVVDDVNRIYGLELTHQNMFNRHNAIFVCFAYLRYWAVQYHKTTKKLPTYEVLARIWNGGPEGYKNSDTAAYWEKVKKHLKQQKDMLELMNDYLKKYEHNHNYIKII